ncbi:MAG: hypothetical protein ACHQIO_23925, partial [Nevskiales bacterium]
MAILFRIYALGRLPGINGDEAWYGVQAQRWAAGEVTHWRTPTGNLPGPIQLGWLLLLQTVFTPSFALLRVPAIISALGAMLLAYAIGRRFFDRTTATVALLLMAALPANIAYARLGWDPSHIGLVILAASYAALAGQRLLSALIFALALIVHPTSIFAAPFLSFVLFGRLMEQHDTAQALRRVAGYIALLLGAILTLALTTSGGQATVSLAGFPGRLFNPLQWLAFAILFGRLLTGDTVYDYITGADFGDWQKLLDLLGMMVVFVGIIIGTRLRGKRLDRDAGVIIGWLASLAIFFLIAGNGALQPHFERYAICLITPTVLALAVI